MRAYTELDRIFIPLIRQKLGAELSPQTITRLRGATQQFAALSKLAHERRDMLPVSPQNPDALMSPKAFLIDKLPDVLERLFGKKVEKQVDNKLNEQLINIADAIIRDQSKLEPLAYQHQEKIWQSPDFKLKLEACFSDVQSAFNMVVTEMQIQKEDDHSQQADSKSGARSQLSAEVQAAMGLKDPLVAMLERKEESRKGVAEDSESPIHVDLVEDFVPELFREKAGVQTEEVKAELVTNPQQLGRTKSF
jgi:hypothetical protein